MKKKSDRDIAELQEKIKDLTIASQRNEKKYQKI